MAASPLLSSLTDPERAYGLTRQVLANPALSINLELVTLTETSAIVTWFTGDPTRIDPVGRLAPMPADTEVLLGTSPLNLRPVFHDDTATPYHYVELTGLEPGATYFFVARSGGLPAIPSVSAFGSPLGTSTLDAFPSGPFAFVTPEPPPGRFLFAVALCNDLHLGETVAGLITTQAGIQIPPGITQVPGEPPYAEVMASALGPEARARGANLLLAAGDISSEAAQIDVADAKAHLDAFGAYGDSYLVARGNHDRPHTSDAAGACRAVPAAPDYHDCFGETFFPSAQTWFSQEAFGMRLLGLDTYDTIGPGSGNGVMSGTQFDFVREELARDPDRPTLVFGHHPVSLEANLTTQEPLLFDLDPQQAQQLESLYAGAPGVFLHHAGHTHRNKRTIGLTATNVVFQEVSAVKEYPGGFHLLRVFSGGYALNFYKFQGAMAQEWSERSRQEYGGVAPFYVFGNAADRNSVVAADFSGLDRAATPPAQTPEPAAAAGATSAGDGTLPATGGSNDGALIGGVAMAAAVAAEHWLRHRKGAGSGT
ncbi:MAG: metallophosphoesterase [Acidimicrobiales bacterium]